MKGWKRVDKRSATERKKKEMWSTHPAVTNGAGAIASIRMVATIVANFPAVWSDLIITMVNKSLIIDEWWGKVIIEQWNISVMASSNSMMNMAMIEIILIIKLWMIYIFSLFELSCGWRGRNEIANAPFMWIVMERWREREFPSLRGQIKRLRWKVYRPSLLIIV